LLALMISMTLNRAEAEDLCQHVFIEAFDNLHKLTDPGNFGPWLLRIGRYRALDAKRTENARQAREARWQSEHIGKQENPELGQDLDQITDKEHLGQQLARLPENYRTVIALHYWMDESIDRIASHLDLPKGTIKSMLYRARKLLAKALRKESK
jgi:RNA polymerase sigma-70 factor (ECF subfamily)